MSLTIMIKPYHLASGLLALSLLPAAQAADTPDLAQIRQEIEQLKQNYESRIQALETRLKEAQSSAPAATSPAAAVASKTPAAGSNAFNPDISLVLSGIYSNLSRDPADYRISNFAKGGEIGPGQRSFSLAESELGVSANIDPWFFGALNFSIHGDDTVSTEEAYIQTTALPYGVKIKAGRFFSGIGYLNEQHAHTWDFADAPLAYQAFLGGQFAHDGAQIKWLAPTDTFIELGSEVGSGSNFPGTERKANGAGAATVFAHTGGDVGLSNSWRAGVSWLRTAPQARADDTTDLAGNAVSNAFSGYSHLWLADFVWKWAPNGNAEHTNFKLQGEYFRRREAGTLAYDTAANNAQAHYSSAQSGWYLQGVYQFMPTWRVGARYDQLYRGRTDYGDNSVYLGQSDFNPSRSTAMIDWTPSEFSRWRLQYALDKSREGATDRQWFLQYQMSLGAHGAHIF